MIANRFRIELLLLRIIDSSFSLATPYMKMSQTKLSGSPNFERCLRSPPSF
ncbi:unnamed protein product [Prunus brigantina]